jgi:hypothetical protein
MMHWWKQCVPDFVWMLQISDHHEGVIPGVLFAWWRKFFWTNSYRSLSSRRKVLDGLNECTWWTGNVSVSLISMNDAELFQAPATLSAFSWLPDLFHSFAIAVLSISGSYRPSSWILVSWNLTQEHCCKQKKDCMLLIRNPRLTNKDRSSWCFNHYLAPER